MKTFLVSASVLIAYTLGANADVICTRAGGCWETHKKIRRHGGAYRYLEHTIPSKSNPSVMVKRVLRPAADHPARTPREQRPLGSDTFGSGLALIGDRGLVARASRV